jgi:HK97 family phage prohead protease
MSSASINDLPDSAFAYIEPGGSKDSSGKTTPRGLRHFPVHDEAHARNALARAKQSPFGKKAMSKILAACRKFGIKVSADNSSSSSGRSEYGMDVERRYTPGTVEVRMGSGDRPKRIGGYAAKFGKLSRNLGGFVERVEPGFFNQSRSDGWPGVICRYNHDDNMLLGSIGGGTLRLDIDDQGFLYEVEPPQARADVLELVERHDVRFSSFAFRCITDEWSTSDGGYPMRSLQQGTAIDVAPVNSPAYLDTSAGLRSLAAHVSAPIEDVVELAEADELRRFFVVTGGPAPVKVKAKPIFGPAALAHMGPKDPWA